MIGSKVKCTPEQGKELAKVAVRAGNDPCLDRCVKFRNTRVRVYNESFATLGGVQWWFRIEFVRNEDKVELVSGPAEIIIAQVFKNLPSD